MTRFSDGKNYQGYALSDDGAHIFLPKEAVDDLAACLAIRRRGLDDGQSLIAWKEAVRADLNVPDLWTSHRITDDYIILKNNAVYREHEGPVLTAKLAAGVIRCVKEAIARGEVQL